MYKKLETIFLKLRFKSKRDENREKRELYNKVFHSFHYSFNIVRLFTSIRLRWAGHIAKIEGRIDFKILE